MSYEKTEAKLRALAGKLEAERWRDCPTPGCRLEEGHGGLHRFVPEVSRLREEVERLTRQVEWQEQRRTEERLKVEESVASWHRREADLVARAEEAERAAATAQARIACDPVGPGGGCGVCLACVDARRRLAEKRAEAAERERGNAWELRERVAASEAREREALDVLRAVIDGYDESGQRFIPASRIRDARALLSPSPQAPSGDVHRDDGQGYRKEEP